MVPLLAVLYFVSRISVVVNFMYQLDWPQDAQINPFSCYVCEGVLGWDWHLIWWVVLPNEAGHHPIHWGPEWSKRQREGEVASFFSLTAKLGHPTHLLCPWTGNLFHHWVPGSRDFGLRPNCVIGLPGSAVCRWQIFGVLSLRNHVSWFLITNTYIFWLSGESHEHNRFFNSFTFACCDLRGYRKNTPKNTFLQQGDWVPDFEFIF